jgi:putative PIN family toxin of toxin-antitoxin system
MISAVLDTNIIVSAHLNQEGPASIILDLAFSRYFRCFVSEVLLEEYEEILKRTRLGLDARDTSRSIRLLRKAATLVVPRRILKVTSDPDDNKIIECALEARADYVVTGNTRHFPVQFQDIRIIRPRQFLTVLAAQLH